MIKLKLLELERSKKRERSWPHLLFMKVGPNIIFVYKLSMFVSCLMPTFSKWCQGGQIFWAGDLSLPLGAAYKSEASFLLAGFCQAPPPPSPSLGSPATFLAQPHGTHWWCMETGLSCTWKRMLTAVNSDPTFSRFSNVINISCFGVWKIFDSYGSKFLVCEWMVLGNSNNQ